MPTYQYHCPHCKTEFEEFQRMTDPALEHCPTCNGKPERLISRGGGLIFKGSGFYITDYKKSGKDGDKSTSSETTKNDSSKTESTKSDSSKSESSKSDTPKTETRPKTDSGGKSAAKE